MNFQAQEIAAKRISTEKKLTEVEGELNRLQRILEEKRAEYAGKEILKGDAVSTHHLHLERVT